MAVGDTTTSAVANSLPVWVSSSRAVREYAAVMPNVVDRVTLGEGIGTSWREISWEQLTAQSVTESQEMDNPQQLDDTLLTITPSVVGIETIITDRVAMRISKESFRSAGGLAQKAIERKKDEDGLAVFAGATTELGSAGTANTNGTIFAAIARIQGNTTEPGEPPFALVAHGFQLKDIQDEVITGVGSATGNVETGFTQEVWHRGLFGFIGGAQVYPDGNITIDSSDDAVGGIFARRGIILVQGRSPWTDTDRKQIGGGATAVFTYDEYAYGERGGGQWLYGWKGDATAPTS